VRRRGKLAALFRCLSQTAVDAVAAANIFHHSDQSVYHAREFLHSRNLNVRPPNLLNVNEA
jgi:cyclase